MTQTDKQKEHRDFAEQLSQLQHPDQDADDRVFAEAWGWTLPLHGAARSELGRLERNGLAGFTARFDAALAALGRLIPDAVWKAGNDGGPNAEVYDPRTGKSFTSVGATPAMALLSAAFHVLSMLKQ